MIQPVLATTSASMVTVFVEGPPGQERERTLAALREQTVSPARVIVGGRTPSDHGRPTAPIVAVLHAGQEPLPQWLAAIEEAFAAGRRRVRTGQMTIGPDGVVRHLTFPSKAPERRNGTRLIAAFAEGPLRLDDVAAEEGLILRPLVRTPANPDSLPPVTADLPPAPRRPRLVSVIIPTFNGRKTLPAQLDALANQTYEGPWELIVADNGSNDGGPGLADRWASRIPGLRVVDASGRAGVSHARNIGGRAARGDLLAFTDQDDLVGPEWLRGLVEAAAEYDLIGGALEKERLNEELSRSDRGIVGDRLPESDGPFLPYAPSNNLAVWRGVLDRIGGWHEEYPAGQDRELSWRAQLCGFRLGFAYTAVVHYRYRARLGPRLLQVWRYAVDQVHLYRDFRDAGLPRRPVPAVLKTWAWIALHMVDLFRGATRRRVWLRTVTSRLGHLWASLRYRVLCP